MIFQKQKPASRQLIRPPYKVWFERQKNANSGMAFALVFTIATATSVCVGSDLRFKQASANLALERAKNVTAGQMAAEYAKINEQLTKQLGTMPQTVDAQIDMVFGDQAANAKRVAKCESGFNPKVENKTSSATGVFQVLSKTHEVKKAFLKDSFINILIAKKLYDASGWTPWVSSIGCHGVK